MARLTKDAWAKLRQDYEVTGMSLGELSKKYEADRGNISKRAKKEGWEKEKVQQIIEKKVSINKELQNISAEITTLSTTGVVEIEREVDRRLRLEGIFNSSLELNQKLADQQLEALGNAAELRDINLHSQIFNRNKDGFIGKMPTTQVNIQNNGEDKGMTAPIIAIPAQETEESWQK